jgi:hypothetical protein
MDAEKFLEANPHLGRLHQLSLSAYRLIKAAELEIAGVQAVGPYAEYFHDEISVLATEIYHVAHMSPEQFSAWYYSADEASRVAAVTPEPDQSHGS